MGRSVFKNLYIIVFVILVTFQISTTNIKQAYTLTPAQIDQQIQRMNMYPPGQGKLGYLLETKKEVQIANKFIENFFYVIDFNEYFPNRIPHVVSPLIFFGLYIFIKNRKKIHYLYISFLLSILLLSLIGPYARYGPVLMYFYFLIFVVFGVSKIISKKII